MPLPVDITPYYTLTIPSSGKEISYRPYTVKEEKLLLMAASSLDHDVTAEQFSEVVNAVSELLDRCIKEDVDTNSLAHFDFEYILCRIYSKSVNNVIDIAVNLVECDGEICKNGAIAKLNLDSDLEVIWPENHSPNIEINSDYVVKMKYPTVGSSVEQDIARLRGTTDHDAMIGLVASSIECVYNPNTDQAYTLGDYNSAELLEWVENLPGYLFYKCAGFLLELPKTKASVNAVCRDCGNEAVVVIDNFMDFFA